MVMRLRSFLTWASVVLLFASCSDDRARGDQCLQRGDWRRAAQFYARAVERDPADDAPRLGLGRALLQKAQSLASQGRDSSRHWDEALYELERIEPTEADTSLPELLRQSRFAQSRALAREGDTLAALSALERLRQEWPEGTAARNLEAILRFKRGDSERARDLFLENVAVDSTDVASLFNLGVLFWHQGRADQATRFLLQASRHAPRDPEILDWLAKVTE